MDIDENVIDALREKIRVEDEANRLKSDELDLARRQMVAAERKQATLDAIFSRYANLGEQIASIWAFVQAQPARDEIFREFLDTLSEHVDLLSAELERIERVLILLLTEHANDEKEIAKSELRQAGQGRENRRLLAQYRKNLQRLREREARAGDNASLELLNQIEEMEAKIARLDT
jgi:hypothetical protein